MADTYDNPWNEILELYFHDFVAFFFPKIHRDIDWNRGYENLDGELEQAVCESETTGNVTDKLIKVWRRDGEERILLIHLEVQNAPEPEFPERMFRNGCRIFDRFGKPVVSVAVLGDDNARWRPDDFGWDLWDCQMGLRFPSVKLRDYSDRWLELELSTNPFATLVMAHLKERATRKDPEVRLRWKIRFVRRLYEIGYGRKDVLELFRVLDWLLHLPPDLELKFKEELKNFEEKDTMRYVTSIERLGIQQGSAAVLKRQMKRRFRQLPGWVEDRLGEATQEELENWADRVLDAQRLEDIFAL